MATKATVIESGLSHQGPIKPESRAIECPDHPDEKWDIGFGYDGGGFGHYRKCRKCGRVFKKEDIGD